MAFTASTLSIIGPQATQPRMWMYSTADAIADVNTANYFLDAINALAVNDVIVAVTSTGGTPVVSHLIVNSNTGSAIDVTDGVAIAATDSD